MVRKIIFTKCLFIILYYGYIFNYRIYFYSSSYLLSTPICLRMVSSISAKSKLSA